MTYSLATIKVKDQEISESNALCSRINELRNKLLTGVLLENETGDIYAIDPRFIHLFDTIENEAILLVENEYDLIMSKPLE